MHLATGALALALAGSYANARLLAYGLGAVYVLVAVLGFIYGDGDEIFGLVPINTEDSVFHLLVGLAGIGAGLATPEEALPAPAPTAPVT